MDMMQSGYEPQWGASGRDDLGVMKTLGANSIRLYHSLGLEYNHDHGKFLDRAEELGLHVMIAMHTQIPCPNFDCSASVKDFTLSGIKQGFLKNKTWHPAISMVILLNEPDSLSFGGNPPPQCKKGEEATCRLQASLSALDGFLQAEKAAGLNTTKSHVNLTITWGPEYGDSIDSGFPKNTLYFGFHDMNLGVANPKIVKYTPKTEKTEWATAYHNRWTHSLNTAQPWSIMKTQVQPQYSQFLPAPWFIGEFRANNAAGAGVESDLKAMDAEASNGGAFLGAHLYQFQKAYQDPKGMPVCGMFELGSKTVADEANVCEDDVNSKTAHCHSWPVYCLNHTKGGRAEAAASAWGGKMETHGSCPETQDTEQLII